MVKCEDCIYCIGTAYSISPITVQKISVGKDSDGNNIVKIISLDGSHRLEAYKKFNEEIKKQTTDATNIAQIFDDTQQKKPILEPITEIEIEYWNDDILDKQEWLEELRIISYQLNMKHGVKVTDSDLEFHAGRIVEDRPLEKLYGIITELAEKFDKTPGRLSQLIGDKVRRRRATRDSLILKLSLEGWTQQEIGDVVGLHQTVVGKINQNFNTKELINLFYGKGVKPEFTSTRVYTFQEDLLSALQRKYMIVDKDIEDLSGTLKLASADPEEAKEGVKVTIKELFL